MATPVVTHVASHRSAAKPAKPRREEHTSELGNTRRVSAFVRPAYAARAAAGILAVLLAFAASACNKSAPSPDDALGAQNGTAQDGTPTRGVGLGESGATPGPRTPTPGAVAIVPVPSAPASFADLVEQVRRGVVNIYTTTRTPTTRQPLQPTLPYGRMPSRPNVERSLGSGFVVDNDGHILTNAHVIEGATSIRVVFHDDVELDAEIVGVDPATDVAVIRVSGATDLHPLPLGDSDSVRVGDWTVAVGNPFGLSSTVTAGILSARSRRDVPLGGHVRYVDFLQTDASINPGNSGGPLLDMAGNVIGINTAVNREGQGIAFAIPANMVREILPQLVDGGRVSRSWLGVFVDNVDPDVALAMMLDDTAGALVTQTVSGGPAAFAGLRPGDVIVRFGQVDVRTPDDLKWIASTAGVGATVPIAVIRRGAEVVLDVVMGELPE